MQSRDEFGAGLFETWKGGVRIGVAEAAATKLRALNGASGLAVGLSSVTGWGGVGGVACVEPSEPAGVRNDG